MVFSVFLLFFLMVFSFFLLFKVVLRVWLSLFFLLVGLAGGVGWGWG